MASLGGGETGRGTFVPNPAGLEELLRGPHGQVARSLARKGMIVQAGAKRRCPVNTGRLRSSIRWTLGSDSKGLFAKIGTDVEYAKFVHEGHGDIYPVNAKMLHFVVDGEDVFVSHVGPVAGVPFLRDALNDIRGL